MNGDSKTAQHMSEYNKLSVSCHQNWVNLYWYFKTRKEAEKKIKEVGGIYSRIPFSSNLNDIGEWAGGTLKVGEKFMLSMTFNVSYLPYLLKYKI